MNLISQLARTFILILLVSQFGFGSTTAVQPEDILNLQYPGSVQQSPTGEWAVFVLRTPRSEKDEQGSAYSELHIVSTRTKETKAFVTGKVNVTSPQWSPDGDNIAFLMKRGKDAKKQVWTIPLNGGEARQLTNSKSDIMQFRWSPQGDKIGYVAKTIESKKEKLLKEKGFDFIYYEENLKHKNLYLHDIMLDKTQQLSTSKSVWDFQFSPDGNQIIAAMTDKNLIDESYMFKKLYLVDISTKELKAVTNNNGKLGNFSFSPDGQKLVYTAALERKDHAVSQVYTLDLLTHKIQNHTPTNFMGHVEWATWKNNETIIYLSGEGVWPTFSTVNIRTQKREILYHSKNTGIIAGTPSFSADTKSAVFVGSTPTMPYQIYCLKNAKLEKLTQFNQNLQERLLGNQKLFQYKTRDGQKVEGLLIYPVNYKKGTRYPLIVSVHGGPEAHNSNGWLSSYSRPGQVFAGKGYFVFYPNYRASTGYGTHFAATGYEDAAGKEFDDIADGIDALVSQGLVNKERVGLGGGSYGGFASAWFASFYTKYVKAVCMFVGISDLISKRGTTDIPYEELYVHSGKKLEDMWQQSLKRSPIYWAHQSKTAVLIYGGTADTRVHPSQSLEFYRRLKMNDHPAVRLVQYPGEGHGNSKQPGRIDVLYRQLLWYDWYVKNKKPLAGPKPPWDISENYGLDFE